MHTMRTAAPSANSGMRLVAALSLAKLFLHLYANRNYGFFVDELNYLACSEHLAWGYVDHPSLAPALLALSRFLFGDSLLAVRLLPALAGAATVFLTGILVRSLGGRAYAMLLACLAVLIAPLFLAFNTLYTMNAFEPLLWLAGALLIVRIIHTGNARLWIPFGLLMGVGLHNKYSMLFFGFAVVIGLLLTPLRSHFRSPWLWLGGALAFLLWLPNLLWLIRHDFPFLELLRNVRASGRNVTLNPLEFLAQQVFFLHPLNLPIWLAGLWYYLASRNGRPYRILGWMWLVILACMLFLSGRVYYMTPAYPILFAAGGIAIQNWFERLRVAAFLRPAFPILMLLTGAVLAPLTLPILPVETFIRYNQALGIATPRIENHRMGPLHQIYADMFGWPEMAAEVARIYHSIPAEERARCGIFGQNYGQAGAIDFFGPKLGLPKAVSGHQTYFFWGPRDVTGECLIVMDDDRETLEGYFESVELAGRVHHPYSMPYEHFDVFICRRPKPAFESLQKVWPMLKKWN